MLFQIHSHVSFGCICMLSQWHEERCHRKQQAEGQSDCPRSRAEVWIPAPLTLSCSLLPSLGLWKSHSNALTWSCWNMARLPSCVCSSNQISWTTLKALMVLLNPVVLQPPTSLTEHETHHSTLPQPSSEPIWSQIQSRWILKKGLLGPSLFLPPGSTGWCLFCWQ